MRRTNAPPSKRRRALVRGNRTRAVQRGDVGIPLSRGDLPGGRQPLGTREPPEDYYEPQEETPKPLRMIVRPPGEGFRHVVTPEQVRARLAELPQEFLVDLERVQLARMTRKKLQSQSYGMQWGTTIYLYPMEDDLTERYGLPPTPSQRIEAQMYGGRWRQVGGIWELVWSEEAIQDFYLNNILIHELGHLVDQRNTSTTDRERFAEWFAIEYGYRPTRSKRPRVVRRRHHKLSGD